MMKIVAIALFAPPSLPVRQAPPVVAVGRNRCLAPITPTAAIPSLLRRRAVIPSPADLSDQAIVRYQWSHPQVHDR